MVEQNFNMLLRPAVYIYILLLQVCFSLQTKHVLIMSNDINVMRSNYSMIHITVAVTTDRMQTVSPVLAL